MIPARVGRQGGRQPHQRAVSARLLAVGKSPLSYGKKKRCIPGGYGLRSGPRGMSHTRSRMPDVRFFHRAGPFPLREIAALVGAEPPTSGDDDAPIHDIAPLESAGPDDISVFSDLRYVGALLPSRARSILISRDLARHADDRSRLMVVKNARLAYALVGHLFYPAAGTRGRDRSRARAYIRARRSEPGRGSRPAPSSRPAQRSAPRCHISYNAVIGEGVRLGEDCRIGVQHQHQPRADRQPRRHRDRRDHRFAGLRLRAGLEWACCACCSLAAC